jgi:hypothetical protein
MSKRKYPTLEISALTNTPYLVFGKGEKLDITYPFQQAVMNWVCEGNAPGVGKSATQELKLDGEVHFEITLKQFKEVEP